MGMMLTGCEKLPRLIRSAEKRRDTCLIAHSGELEVLMATYSGSFDKATQYGPPPRVIVDRPRARTAAWYEFFPRSAGGARPRLDVSRLCAARR